MTTQENTSLGQTVPPGTSGRAKSVSIETLATTINRAIEQAEELGIPSAAQLLMMARLEVDLTEIALETKLKKSA
ncbi:hypothetical protein [Rhodopseudomonas pseudopalustris]|uniref:Uncharacterized protein n=2 Tax=Rhodopseudomonas TaxID=1073 RepID=Q13E47_RHOPS|nr:hypothetical protein [Rhodopseudomonas pseudopalustris]ABE37642.1 hypothetical protein RPD_0404 [Rhodopseudomonas palustris BisB5]MBB1089979.1 hypothetical protein [Rhodopseudomonas palustris]SEP35094.1 hypothetical protein SAMN05444123_11656 [Rhodopseudomonas pseudopalustris]